MTDQLPDDDVMGVEAAAAALGIGRTTLYRDVRLGKVPNRGTQRSPKVSVAEARRAREEHTDPAKQRSAALVARSGAYYEHRTDFESVKAQKAALELAKMLGHTVERAAVEEAIETAARELRNALMRRWRTLSLEFEGLTAREIEAKGIASDHAALAELERKLNSFDQYDQDTDTDEKCSV